MEAVTDFSPGAGRAPAIHFDGDRRDLRLDACRGLALWFIFIDHIPDNAFGWLTLRNYGFSDATEVFVFVSGYTCMLAYGGALREQGWPTIVARSFRRGFEIYAAFLLLLIGYFVLIRVAGGGSRYLDDTNTRFFFENPGVALMHAMVLQYTPVDTDILPTFALLHLAFPVVLWLLIRNAAAALALSFLLYLMVQRYSWHVPAWPTGEMYFNPMAWQLLFVFGAWYADQGAGRLKMMVQSRAALWLAALYLALSLVVTLSWQIEPLEMADPRCGVTTHLPDLQKPFGAAAARAFSGAGRRGLAADAARLARADESLNNGDDPLRRKLARRVLHQRPAVVCGLRDPEGGFRQPCHAGHRQRRRDWADDRGCDPDDVGSQA